MVNLSAFVKPGLAQVLFISITAITDGQSFSPFSIHNFTKQTYKAENQNWSITEDNKSSIYAANNIGLLEFDGIDWTFYPSPNGTIIRSVAVGADNRIFTSGYRELGYWERDALGTLNYHSLNKNAESFFNSNEEFWTIIVNESKVYLDRKSVV